MIKQIPFIFLLLFFFQTAFAQRIAVIGDYGLDGTYEDSVAKLVKSWKPDFIITAGDNNYPDGADGTIDQNIGKYYRDFIYPYYGAYPQTDTVVQNRFFPSFGNHDLYTSLGQAYKDYFTLPEAYPGNERYYTITRGNVQLIALNSDSSVGKEPDGTSFTSQQAFWLMGALAGSTAQWKLIYFHHSPYSSGQHGNATWMQWPFDVWGATAVISGHDHHYERLMFGSFPYFVNGLGGKSLYSIVSIQPQSAVRYNANYGAMLITATADSIQFCFSNISDSLIDCHTLYTNTDVNEMGPKPWLNVFPNPFTQTLTIIVNLKSKMEIYNAIGESVGKWELEIGKNEISTAMLAKGLYLLHLETEKGILERKIIKE